MFTSRHELIQAEIKEHDAERLDIEEQYTSLQEELTGKTKKLKKLKTMILQAESEAQDLTREKEQEEEDAMFNLRELEKEV